ncbi:hypothetical protein GEV43_22335 [Actinomadura sp. J1-007]|nr:hypothetical protein [Actinomadura sp. J1-007]
MGATALTAVAAVAALAVTVPGGEGSARQRDAAGPAGSQILLVAASRAESAGGTGAYWRVRQERAMTFGAGKKARRTVLESWAQRDGRSWTSWKELAGPHAGRSGFFKNKGSHTFLVCDKEMTYAQVASLPTAPAALRGAVRKAMLHNDDGPVPANAQDDFVTSCLANLLVSVPAAPKTRAAAYRALASSKGVTVTGKTRDPRGKSGVGVTVKGSRGTSSRFVIDPQTSLVLSEQTESLSTGGPGEPAGAEAGDVGTAASTVYLQVGWTDEKPHPPAS